MARAIASGCAWVAFFVLAHVIKARKFPTRGIDLQLGQRGCAARPTAAVLSASFFRSLPFPDGRGMQRDKNMEADILGIYDIRTKKKIRSVS